MDDADCVKVVMQFVIKLHARKGTDSLPAFLETVVSTAYSNKAICDIQGVDCAAHNIETIEVNPCTLV